MDKLTAESLSKIIQISKDYIVREEYEMLLLKELYESEFGSNLIFKGGTALRLAYSSPRFSEDLDFSLVGTLDSKKFMSFINRSVKKYPGMVGAETYEKYNTIFSLVKVKIDYLDRAFSIKIEISKRKDKLVNNKDYIDKTIKSEVAPLTVLAQVASLGVILKGKKDALNHRKVARDVFDFWFINQLLKKEAVVNFSGYDRTRAKNELHKLLARPFWRLVDSWLE